LITSTAIAWFLLAGIVVIAIVHTASRVGGAVVALVWLALSVPMGISYIQEGNATIDVFRIPVPSGFFFVVIGALASWYASVVIRAGRRRRNDKSQAPLS
jgi:peptidoglycan/LPS O-acetylase OafA/YrhL